MGYGLYQCKVKESVQLQKVLFAYKRPAYAYASPHIRAVLPESYYETRLYFNQPVQLLRLDRNLKYWIQSKKEDKDQESIQSSTTPDPGYQWESDISRQTGRIDQVLLLITFANSLDPDQARQNVGPDLDPNCLTL